MRSLIGYVMSFTFHNILTTSDRLELKAKTCHGTLCVVSIITVTVCDIHLILGNHNGVL